MKRLTLSIGVGLAMALSWSPAAARDKAFPIPGGGSSTCGTNTCCATLSARLCMACCSSVHTDVTAPAWAICTSGCGGVNYGNNTGGYQ